MREAWWIDHFDQVVINESAAVAGLPSTAPQIVLNDRQRAGEAGELDQRAIDDGGHMRPYNAWPAPGEKGATHNEADEEQMDDHHKVSANSIPHLVTCHDNTSIPQNRPNNKISLRL
jgi:hypothetical protein